ncbi:MAG: hypothetical protein WC716_06720 [Chitinophagaceae bacterium]|jgi:hypothetical protein
MKKIINSKAGSAYPFLDARTPMADSDMLPVKLTITLNSAQFPLANQKMFTNLFKSEAALKSNMKTDMSILFQRKIDELTAEDNAGSKSFYEQSLVAFNRCKTSFFLEDITPAWLKGFKAWWLSIDTQLLQHKYISGA